MTQYDLIDMICFPAGSSTLRFYRAPHFTHKAGLAYCKQLSVYSWTPFMAKALTRLPTKII